MIPVELPILVDSTRLIFRASVLAITMAVFLFSKNYMSGEKFYIRFHCLVLLFVASIILLIFRPRIIRLLMGWDGLGVTSYLLVIYFHRHKSLNAGLITGLSNRVGDCLILLSIAALRASVRWFPGEGGSTVTVTLSSLALITLVVAAFTKSAQVPFSAWLPAAIAAPTPVSSLVHSSTLVTAGVYLLIRYTRAISYYGCLRVVLGFGVATILIAGTRALFESDIKKIVALSTLRQLGLIIRALGAGVRAVSFFHLLTHAYFKALLFMTVGNLIHLTDGFQDSRKTGADSWVSSPTLAFCLVANIRLIGLPFLSGFFSKDLIMEHPMATSSGGAVPCLFFMATLLTSAYTSRFVLRIIAGKSRTPKRLWVEDQPTDLPLANRVLLPLTVMGGSLLSWALISEPCINVIPASVKSTTLGVIRLGTLGGILWLNFESSAYMKEYSWNWGLMWSLPLSRSPGLTARGLALRSLNRGWDLSWLPNTLRMIPRSLFAISSVDGTLTKTRALEILLLPPLILFFVFG